MDKLKSTTSTTTKKKKLTEKQMAKRNQRICAKYAQRDRKTGERKHTFTKMAEMFGLSRRQVTRIIKKQLSSEI